MIEANTEKAYYKSGYKYQLTQPITFQTPIYTCEVIADFILLNARGELTCFRGYAWDGCSGPTLDDKTNIRPSIAHDALYQLMQGGFISSGHKETADRLFQQLCIADGMSRFRAWLYYLAVRLYGKTDQRITKVEVAP